MSDPAPAFRTPPAAPAWQRWLVFSPAARLVFFAAMLSGMFLAMRELAQLADWPSVRADAVQRALAGMTLSVLPTLLAYLSVVRLIEQRAARELSLRTLPLDGLAGMAAGAGLFSLVVGLLWLLGGYHVIGVNPQVAWPQVLVAGIGAGVAEEIAFRGALFRMIEEGLGTWAALLGSALLFGGAHAFNPGATAWSSLAIAIEAGLMLALLYHVTRSLWPCIGLHAAWNVMQGTVYGIPVSGLRADGWLVSYRSGPDWLSGGAFGAEASVVALGVCSLATLGLLAVARRRGSIVPCRPCHILRRRLAGR